MGVWSSWGCELLLAEEYTSTCRCNHTTSFAVLMKINVYKVPRAHEVALSVITSIGCSISMITMFIALTIFTCVRSLNSERVYVHRNLCMAILCSQVAFLAGIKATEHKTVCRIAAIILHYCYTSVFTWMFVEGMHLYTKVVQVYGTTNSRTTYYLFFGWGIPLLLVTISAVADIEGYGSPNSCWLSIYRKTIWAFVGPAIAVITINVGILAMVLNIVISSTRLNQPRHVEQIRAGVKAAVVLLPLLGLTWLFGLLAINKDLIIFEYLFALFNSLQGFFVFLFHCLLNSEVREALRRLREQHALQHEVSDTPSSLSDTQDRTSAMRELDDQNKTPRATIQIRAGLQLYLPVEQGTSTRNEGKMIKPSKGLRPKGPANQEKVVVCAEFKTGVCNNRKEDDLAVVYI